MKRNDWILLISVFLYSYLFYDQWQGINFLVFNIFIVGALLIKNKNFLKSPAWIAAAAGSLVSSFFITWYSNPLSIITNVISLALLSGISVNTRSSFLMSLFITLCSVCSSYVFMFIDWAERRKQRVVEKVGRPVYVTLLLILITFVIALLFFLMYRSANPLFDEFMKNINLDFISIPWIAFTLGGLVLMYGFFYNRRLGYFSDVDENASDVLSEEKAQKGIFGKIFKIETERLSGIMLLVVLNLLLLIVNALDLYYLWFDGTLPEGISHSEFVHKGVGMLITSIISATLIILFYFRGMLNFQQGKNVLKMLAIFWIAQNAFMIFSTAFRNNMYIVESGLSYKRIGVYVYLLLALSGLITTWIKVAKRRSNWFLFRKNGWIFYSILVIGCMFNWDVMITDFNIRKSADRSKKIDKYFLAGLSFKNLPQLFQLPDSAIVADDYEARDHYFNTRGVYFYDFRSALHSKLFRFLSDMQDPDWQSWCAEKERVKRDLLRLEQDGRMKELNLSYCGIDNTLKPIHSFSRLESLDLGHNHLDDLEELSHFPALKVLKMPSSVTDSLEKLPKLTALRELNIAGNRVKNLAPLAQAPNLENLDISGMDLRSLSSLPTLKKLKHLDLSANPIEDFSKLSGIDSLETLVLPNTFAGRIDSIPNLTALQRLDVSSNALAPANLGAFMEKVKGFQNLEYLNLSNNNLENLYVLTQLYPQAYYLNNWSVDKSKGTLVPLFPKLKDLDITNNKIDNLQGIECFRELERLSVGGNSLRELKALCLLPKLKSLTLHNNYLQDIESLSCLTNLEELTLINSQLSRDAAFLDKMKNLQRLTLSSNSINSISAIATLSSLQTLNLNNNKIESLKGIEQLKNLEYLYLDNNPITDFTPLYSLKGLKELHLGEMPRKQLEEIKKALPGCRVTAGYMNQYYPSEEYNDVNARDYETNR